MEWLISLLLGAAFGSFANVCILRLPDDESIAGPSSHCPRCGHALRVQDNIPLLSYLLLRGRCHFCHERISLQYPLVEAGLMIIFLLNAFWFSGQIPRIALADLLAFYCLTISVIDYRHRIIPDELSLSLLAIGIVIAWWNPFFAPLPGMTRLLTSVVAMVAGGSGMLALAWVGEKIFKKEAMGGGDIKLVAAFGALLGWKGIWSSLLFGSFSGAFAGLALMALSHKKRGDTLPFGPFLCLGAFAILLLPARWITFICPIFP